MVPGVACLPSLLEVRSADDSGPGATPSWVPMTGIPPNPPDPELAFGAMRWTHLDNGEWRWCVDVVGLTVENLSTLLDSMDTCRAQLEESDRRWANPDWRAGFYAALEARLYAERMNAQRKKVSR
jgi:hypothetical protein